MSHAALFSAVPAPFGAPLQLRIVADAVANRSDAARARALRRLARIGCVVTDPSTLDATDVVLEAV